MKKNKIYPSSASISDIENILLKSNLDEEDLILLRKIMVKKYKPSIQHRFLEIPELFNDEIWELLYQDKLFDMIEVIKFSKTSIYKRLTETHFNYCNKLISYLLNNLKEDNNLYYLNLQDILDFKRDLSIPNIDSIIIEYLKEDNISSYHLRLLLEDVDNFWLLNELKCPNSYTLMSLLSDIIGFRSDGFYIKGLQNLRIFSNILKYGNHFITIQDIKNFLYEYGDDSELGLVINSSFSGFGTHLDLKQYKEIKEFVKLALNHFSIKFFGSEITSETSLDLILKDLIRNNIVIDNEILTEDKELELTDDLWEYMDSISFDLKGLTEVTESKLKKYLYTKLEVDKLQDPCEYGHDISELKVNYTAIYELNKFPNLKDDIINILYQYIAAGHLKLIIPTVRALAMSGILQYKEHSELIDLIIYDKTITEEEKIRAIKNIRFTDDIIDKHDLLKNNFPKIDTYYVSDDKYNKYRMTYKDENEVIIYKENIKNSIINFYPLYQIIHGNVLSKEINLRYFALDRTLKDLLKITTFDWEYDKFMSNFFTSFFKYILKAPNIVSLNEMLELVDLYFKVKYLRETGDYIYAYKFVDKYNRSPIYGNIKYETGDKLPEVNCDSSSKELCSYGYNFYVVINNIFTGNYMGSKLNERVKAFKIKKTDVKFLDIVKSSGVARATTAQVLNTIL